MGSKEWQGKENSTDRKGQKRKLDQQQEERESTAIVSGDALRREVAAQVDILAANFSWTESDRASAKRATHLLAELAKNGMTLTLFVQ